MASDDGRGRSKPRNDRPQLHHQTIYQVSGTVQADDDDDFMEEDNTKKRRTIEYHVSRSREINERARDDNESIILPHEGEGDRSIIHKKKHEKTKLKGKKVEGKRVKRIRNVQHGDYPNLRCRTSPFSLVETIKNMTPDQKDDVREIGFGHILNFRITEVPGKMSYWVVNNFDPRSCDLIISDNRRIHIETEDVHRVFGFPMGDVVIEDTLRDGTCSILSEWMNMFRERKATIGQKDVIKKIDEDKAGGVWFKRNFVVLLMTSLVQNTSHGYIYPSFMSQLDDISKIKELNWCKFTLKCLMEMKFTWDTERQKSFLGSSLFLTLFYVDRVLYKRKECNRLFPLCINWDNASLRNRQNEELNGRGFGGGHPLDPILIEPEKKQTCFELSVDCHQHKSKGQSRSTTEYIKDLISTAKEVANKLVYILETFHRAPVDIYSDCNLKKAIETIQKLIGCMKKESDIYSSQMHTHTNRSEEEDAFWTSEDLTKCFEDVVNAITKKDDFLNRTDDMPSFSLGLTQIVDTDENANMKSDFRGEGVANMHDSEVQYATYEHAYIAEKSDVENLQNDIGVEGEAIVQDSEVEDATDQHSNIEENSEVIYFIL